jgi:hypothetical protein
MAKTETAKENLVPVAAKIPPELAAALAGMADAGDRSVSGEIRRAIREHVDRSDVGYARTLAERRAPGDLLSVPAVEAPPLAGDT